MRDEFKNSENWTKRFLPHYNAAGKFQMITYRLADSLPKTALSQLESELKPGAPHSDAGYTEAQRRRKIEYLLDQSLGSCILKYPDVAEKVIEAWKHHNNIKYALIAYVVMPNHVHILIETKPDSDLGKIIWSWKKYVSSHVFGNPQYIEILKKCHSNLKEIYVDSRAPDYKKGFIKPASECGAPRINLWQREYWDRFIRDEKHFKKAIEYIHMNPVVAGLVSKPENWKFSSMN
ncbi:MAG: transposase [Lentisphaeraceae bacterium]|nr:transposase [Lentisphaeraceae bacterium]